MTYEEGSLEGFLTHNPNDRFSKFVGNWKKADPPQLDVFLHTKMLPVPVWRHPMYKVLVIEDKATKEPVMRVWGDNLVCAEHEVVLKAQWRRKPDGTREVPVQSCCQCKLIDAVYLLLEEEKLKWTQPILRFQGDLAKETRVIHAGGLIGEFGKKDLDAQELELLRKVGISQKEDAWKETFRPKAEYLCHLVDARKVGDGLKVSWETAGLGDKIRDVIRSQFESWKDSPTPDKGSIVKSPYCIRFKFNDAEKDPHKKYSVNRLDSVEATGEILAIIQGPKPDYAALVKPPPADELRARLEKAAFPEFRKLLDWDAVFGKPKAAADKPAEPRAPEVGGAQEDDDKVLCDNEACRKPIGITDKKCEHCGHVYEVEEEAKPAAPPPPPTRRTRAEVMADKPKGDKIPF